MYQAIKFLHIGCVVLSLAGFVLRARWALVASPLRHTRLLRVLPHAVDTVLLASAIALATMSHQIPFVDAWLGAKVVGLVAYIALGALALRPGRWRIPAFVAALLCYAYIVSVAVSKNPLGALGLLS